MPSDRVTIFDRRVVEVPVSGRDPLYTLKGNRPIDPIWVKIHYSINPDSGFRRVSITIGGHALFPRKSTTAMTRTFEPDQAPAWATDLVEQYWPAHYKQGDEQ